MEMKKFSQNFYDGVKDETYFESCGIADLITVRRLIVEEDTVQDPDYHASSHFRHALEAGIERWQKLGF